jgi:prepilin-type N-terminal cleavage/methylation domain-containing protein
MFLKNNLFLNMKMKNKAFTLVELLVVITILAIISVVAYQNFWWAVSKAVSWRKISDVATIETSLQQYKVDKNYYPAVWTWSTTNMWWYDYNVEATQSNTISVVLNWSEIQEISDANWWWRVMNLDWTQQIWAKGTISQEELGKAYLTRDLYDPEVWDLKVWGSWKMIDSWIGRYVYAVYRKPTWPNWLANNRNGTYYNIAYTVKKEWSDIYMTKIVWDYDSGSCFDDAPTCPRTLIWSRGNFLINDQEQWKNADWTPFTSGFWSTEENQWIPYPVNDFSE